MARVSLVNPALFMENDPYAKKYDPKIPIGLLYLASMLETEGHSVQIIDAAFDGLTSSQIIVKLKQFNPNYIGFTCVSANRKVAIELAKLVKIILYDVPKIVFGGIHPTLDPETFLAESAIDYVISGEGEYALMKLCSENEHPSKIDGLSYKGKGNEIILSTKPADRIRNLDALPFPAYHLLDMQKYFQKRKTICMVASRGCIFDCNYCASTSFWGKTIIFRSPENVFSEIKNYLNKFPDVRNYHFLDDNFTAGGRFLVKFCNLVNNLSIKWRCIGCIEHLCEEVIAIMANSGCYSISFGVESGSEKIQWNCRKQIDLQLLPKKIELLRKHGIHTKAFFMFGFPGETKEDILQTIHYSLRLKEHGLEDAAFMSLIPYPGTEVHAMHSKKHLHGFGDVGKATDWLDTPDKSIATKLAKYRIYPLISANEFFTGMQLRTIAKEAYALFYSNECSEPLVNFLENNF